MVKDEIIKIEDREIYLIIFPNDLMTKLSINQWNELINRYENDKLSLVTPFDEEYDGYCFITTTLKNLLENHSFYDLRFLCDYRAEKHLSFKDKKQ